jgi:hypothetical protein
MSLLLAALAACATDDGTTPTISDLTASPTTMTVGQQATVGGTMLFEDADGDLVHLAGEIVLPDNTVRALAKTSLAGVGTMTSGTLAWQMIVVPPMAGNYTLSLWVIDADGHESNHVDTTATASP